eukprot:TRINITY_DN15244_c0_g1_i1.p1 TRINITY_DN15244_c0_g1~~TRINITY_DN15244_c0_g1_i1.p1  ORF type:complete len:127 (+),score=28.10 TRINITY_DN15244_c0_g1_i1:162-542(+)
MKYGDDLEIFECPICTDELDITDINFKPCKCGYQMCRFCWNRIIENHDGKCPACRQPYKKENYSFTPPDPESLAKAQQQKKLQQRQKKSHEIESRKHLMDVRVVQRNLVYVTNLALESAKEEVIPL